MASTTELPGPGYRLLHRGVSFRLQLGAPAQGIPGIDDKILSGGMKVLTGSHVHRGAGRLFWACLRA